MKEQVIAVVRERDHCEVDQTVGVHVVSTVRGAGVAHRNIDGISEDSDGGEHSRR